MNTSNADADSLGQKGGALDETNLRILAAMRENGRISMAALAEHVGISRASAYNRVEQMTSTGIITGFTATVNPRLVGLQISALVFVTVHPQSWHDFREAVLQMPDVEYCSITTGEHDAMLIIRSVDITGVHDFVTGVVSMRPEVKAVVSVVVLDEIVRKSFLLPTDIPDRTSVTDGLGMTRFTPVAQGRSEMARS